MDYIATARQWISEQTRITALAPNDPSRVAAMYLQAKRAESIIPDLLEYLAGYEDEHRTLALKVNALHAASTPGNTERPFQHWTVAENLSSQRARAFVAAMRDLFRHTGQYRPNGTMTPMWPTTFDAMYFDAALKYAPQIGATKLKAQGCRESGLDPSATNPTSGAAGIAQFMLDTWPDMISALKFPVDASPYNAALAIEAQAYYMNHLWNEWHAPQRTALDRWRLSLASYDAGLGEVLRAQNLAHGALDYATIIAQLHLITGADAVETIAYVEAIEKIATTLAPIS